VKVILLVMMIVSGLAVGFLIGEFREDEEISNASTGKSYSPGDKKRRKRRTRIR